MNPTKPAPTEPGLVAVICAWWKSWRMLKQWSPSTVGMALALLVTLFIFMDWQMTPGLAKILGYANQAVRWEDVPNLDYNYAVVLKILPWLAAVVVAVALGTGVVQTMGLLSRQIKEVWWVEKMEGLQKANAIVQRSPDTTMESDDALVCGTSMVAGREFGRLSPEERRRLPELIAYSATSNLHQIVMPNLDQLKHQEQQWKAYLAAVEQARATGTEENKARIKMAADQKARMILDRVFAKAGWLNDETRRLWRDEGFLSPGFSQISSVQDLRKTMEAIAAEIEDRVQILSSGTDLASEGTGLSAEGFKIEVGRLERSRPGIVMFEEDAFPKRLFFFSRDDFITGILEEAYRNARSSSAGAGSIQVTFHYAYPMVWISIMRQSHVAGPAAGPVAKAAMGMGAYYMDLAASLGNISVCHLQPGASSCDDVVFIGLWARPVYDS